MKYISVIFMFCLFGFCININGAENPNPTNMQQQSDKYIVKGIVYDENDLPLPGASIFITNTRKGIISDIDGKFQIEIPKIKDATIVVSFIGMKPQKFIINNNSNLNVSLKPDVYSIDEVVIEGAYGTQQKRSDQVGSAFQINTDKIKSTAPTRIDKILDAIIPGVSVDVNSDSPTARQRYNVRVRGDASMSASNEPLWIVDGTPIYTGDRTNQVTGMSYSVSPLSFINPDDIESITVLKDASAASIYGANGANGVILVKTKSGRTGKTKINLSVSGGFAKINKDTQYQMLNGEEWLELAKESYKNAGHDMKIFPFQDNEMNSYSTTSTDWSDVYFDTGNSLTANLSLSGGNDKNLYFVSGSFYDLQTTVKGNRQQRFTARINNEYKFHEKLKVKLSMGVSYNINNLFSPGKDYYDNLPIYDPYNADGTFRLYNTAVDGYDNNKNLNWKTSRFLNSVAEREENDNRQRTFYSNNNLSIDYKVIEGLNITSQLGFDYQSAYEDMYNAMTNWSGMSIASGPYGYSTRSHANFLYITNIERINFNRSFGKHNVNALLGFELKSQNYNTLGATGSYFVNDYIKEISYAVNRSGSSSQKTTHMLSYFVQAGYNYDKRYYLSVNGRKDGSSSFGKDVKWANFGSVAGSWNINHEKFYSESILNTIMPILKLKTSYGTNGNSRLGSQESLGTYSYSESNNYAGEAGTSLSSSANPGLSWETTYMFNSGIRMNFFNRIDMEVEYYNNKTVDLLSNLDVSRTTGDTRVYRNVGRIRNKGIEVTINTINIARPIEWTTEIIMTHNQNKLLELYNGIEKVFTNTIYREGYDINSYYVVRWAGVDPRDGAPLWLDKNDNITRIYDYENRIPYKSSTPKITGSVNNKLSWVDKGLSLSFRFKYMVGGYAFSTFGRGVASDGLYIMNENQSIDQLDRWQKPGDLALSPKPIWGVSTKSVMNSTRHMYSKTHLSLQNVILNYQLPKKLIKNFNLENASLSVLCENLGIWTPYDKEGINSYRNSMSGYPSERTFSFGFDVRF